MDAIKSQTRVLKRVVGEAQDADLEELASGLIPAIQQLDSIKEEAEVEDWIESLEGAVGKAVACFQLHGLSKWMTKIFRKKKYKTDKETVVALVRDLGHCATVAQILVLINCQTEKPDEDPLILWVDDTPGNNVKERQRAETEHGINFQLETSTKGALEYLRDNANLKEKNPSAFRIVTDWYRPDEKDDAAHSLIQKSRAEGWSTPILIYCSEDTDTSEVLAEETLTCATSNDHLLAFFWASTRLSPTAVAAKAPKRTASATKKGKKATSAVEEKKEEEESVAPIPAAKITNTKKAASAISPLDDDDDDDGEDFGAPKAKSTKAKSAGSTRTKSALKKSTSAKQIAAAAVIEEDELESAVPEKEKFVTKKKKEEEEEEEAIPATMKMDTPMDEKTKDDEEEDAPATMEVDTPVKNVAEKEKVMEEEDEEEIPATMDVDAPADAEPILPTLPTGDTIDQPELSKRPTGAVVAPKAPSNIYNVLASRIPKPEVVEDVDDDNEVTLAHTICKPKLAKKTAKKAAQQLFGDDEDEEEEEEKEVKKKMMMMKEKKTSKYEDDEEEYVVDDGEKMNVDDDEEYEVDEGSKKNKKSASSSKAKKASISRQATAEIAAPSTPKSSIPAGSKKKTDWTALLASRIPTNGPLSPLSSEGAYDHLLATPPPKKIAKKTTKAATAPITKSPEAVTTDVTPLKSETSSPTDKPRPPKPLAPMGPTPVRSLSALDDSDGHEGDEDEDDVPLFNKVSAPSPKTVTSNIVAPHMSTVYGLGIELQIGILASFQVETKNKSSRLVTHGGATVSVGFTDISGKHAFDGYVEDCKNGTYSVRCFPTRIGQYIAAVLVDHQHIHGSPFTIDVVSQSKKRSLDPYLDGEDEDTDLQPPPKKSVLPSTFPEEGEDGEGYEATQVV